MFTDTTIKQQLDQAARAIQRGEIPLGEEMLRQVLGSDPKNSLALLWLTKCTKDPYRRAELFQQVLSIDPANPHALKGMKLYGRYARSTSGGNHGSLVEGTSVSDGDFEQAPPHMASNQADKPYMSRRRLEQDAHGGGSDAVVIPSQKTKTPQTGNLQGALLIGAAAIFFIWLVGQCSGSGNDRSPKVATADPAGQAAIRAVQNQSTLLADNMHESIGLALVITELEGHTTSIDGWYVSSASDHHSVKFKFYVDNGSQSAEWWYYSSGTIVPRDEWAFVFMGQ